MLSITTKAKSAVYEGRIVRINLNESYYYLYVFLGKYRDYIMSENMCTCKDFLFNVVYRSSKNSCYHQEALKYAIENDKVVNIKVSQKVMIDILMEIYTMDKSYILRKLLFSRGSSY